MEALQYYTIAVEYMRCVFDDVYYLDDAMGYAIGECYTNRTTGNDKRQRFKAAQDLLGVTTEMALNRCCLLYTSKSKCATFTIQRDAFWLMYHKKMSESGIINHMAFLALKSIQGKRKMAKCSNCLWLSRMACSTKIINPNEYPQQVQDLNTKYKCKMLRKKMAGMFGVSFFVPKGAKGWYFSVSHSSDEIVQMLNKQYTQKSEAPF